MAVCAWCCQEMHARIGCTVTVFNHFEDNEPRPRIPFGGELLDLGRHEYCPDCLSPLQGFHHPGCDIEQCPCCNKQALTCGCAVQFRPSAEVLMAALDAYGNDREGGYGTETLVYTDIYALDKYPVTSVFHWPSGADPLGWWFFAEERQVSAAILRVTPFKVLAAKDSEIARMLQLPAGKKAFREGRSSDWDILDID